MNNDDFLQLFDVTSQDLNRIGEFGKLVSPKIDEVVDALYVHMQAALGDTFTLHFSEEKALTRAKSLSRRAWLEFLAGQWDERYIQSRVRIGEVHAQLQIEPRHYLAIMEAAVDMLIAAGIDGIAAADREDTIHAIRCVANMEAAMVVDVYSTRTTEIITQQSRALTDMSTPITAIWDGILMLPVVGIVDSRRAQDIMQRMLEQIAEKRALVFILDISGVAVVDTAVANHLIRMTKAARLMGSYTIVSGLSPSVAQTIVELGIEVGDMKTTGNLQDALKIAFERAGVEQKVAAK